MAPVDYAASAAVAAPALCVACLHAVTVRRPPRSEGGTRAAATSAGGVVRLCLASAAAVACHLWQHDAALLYAREQLFHEPSSHTAKYNEKQNELITDL